MTLRDEFLAEVESFLTANDLEPSAFGRAALKDPNFVAQLRAGRSPSLSTVDKVHSFMGGYRPPGRRQHNEPRDAAA